MIGRDQSQQRLARFLAVWPQLAARHSEMFVYADLRYANGFAVRWPDAQAPAVTPPSTPSAGNT